MRLEADLESLLRRLDLEPELATSEERLPPMRALNMAICDG